MALRYLLAFVLSFAVIIAWRFINPPPQRVPPPAAPAVAGKQEPTPVPVAAGAPAGQTPEAGSSRTVSRERRTESVQLEDDGIEYVADSRGACLSQVRLPQYREAVDSKEPYEMLFPSGGGAGTLGLLIEDKGPGESTVPWDESWDLSSARTDGATIVEFANDIGSFRVKKTVLPGSAADLVEFARTPEDFRPRHVKVRLEFTNVSGEKKPLVYRLYGPVGIDSEDFRSPGTDLYLAYGTGSPEGRVETVRTLAASQFTGGFWESGGEERIAWVAAQNNYFTSILFPLSRKLRSALDKGFGSSYPDPQHIEKLAQEKHRKPLEALDPLSRKELETSAYVNLRVGLRVAGVTIEPGASVVHEYGLYLGMRDAPQLASYGDLDFKGVNQYGMWGFLVKLFINLLSLLNFAGWGMAIIFLTFLVKLCLHPINKRSQGSMMRFQKKMQKIKPEMDEIKTRFANNRAKVTQETQKLWKKHGVNPGQQMAGCLILFLQLPIWIGLLSTLQYAPGLRQASFLYIADLTRPDKLVHMGLVNLPFLGSFLEYFNLLPLLYVILTVINQRMQPRPEDPQMLAQYRMMTFMMVFFGFIFYNFPAGFMLYIMTSSGLGIIENKIIKAELAREEGMLADGGAAAGSGASGAGPMYPGRAKKPDEDSSRAKGKRGR